MALLAAVAAGAAVRSAAHCPHSLRHTEAQGWPVRHRVGWQPIEKKKEQTTLGIILAYYRLLA